MKIVEFTPDLIDSVVKIENACFSDGWNGQMLRSAFDGGRYFGYCAVDNGEVVAFIGCSLGLDACDLESVAVMPKHRGKGVAKNLVALACERAVKGGVSAMMLEVRESNVNAITLYEGCGFERISVRKRYYPDGETAVVYRKEL